jgi:amino acid adenylation domain-containing protein
MSDVLQRITRLSAKEKRELLAKTLRESLPPRPASTASLPILIPAQQERHKPFPLTPMQQAYWIGRGGAFELGNVGAHVYFEVDAPRLDLQKCNLALKQLIARHEMLRAVLRPDGTQEILEVAPPYAIKITDVLGEDSVQAAARLDAIRQRMSTQVFAADQWPLFEVHAARSNEQHTRLYFSFDLMICDLRSMQIFLDEWLQFYLNAGVSLAPLELSFRDYVLAERGWQDSAACKRSREYWQNRISDLPLAPDLPLARPLATVSRPRFVRRTTRLEPERWSQLKSRARQCGLTPAALLLAIFAEILTAWSRSPRFTLNLSLFNRLPIHPQVNDIIGEFTSMILLGVDNSIGGSFQARAARIQQQFWTDLDHRHFHGLGVLRELARLQGGGPSAVMPVVFTCDLVHDFIGHRAVPSPRLPGEVVYGISQTPQVCLDHQSWEQGGALVINWDVVEEVFPEGLVSDMFGAEASLLHQLADDAQAWQQTTPWCAAAAQREQQTAVNAADLPIMNELLHTAFARQVRMRPAQPAVVAPDGTLTYEELSWRSDQVARRLRQAGARPNNLVAVVMDKSWEQVVAVLGVLRSGAAYLPIDPELPQERIWFLLENGEARLVVTNPSLRERLPWPAGVQLFCVHDEQPSASEDRPLEPAQAPDDLAYVIYTSGSTGTPKGVMIDHRGALNTLTDINRRFNIGPCDRVLALSCLNFDLSVYDIFGMLAAGGTIVMPESAASRDPARWSELMAREQVTIWNSVPALMEMLVQQVTAEGAKLPAALRLVLLSGDWISLSLPDRIKSLTENAQVVSLGGATEASIWSILYPIEEVAPGWKSIPYGKPLGNQRFEVLNECLNPCPTWVSGQLHIGGIGLAKGYWRDEEKTRASFITHPRTGERLYRTGDLGRYLPDGNIEFLGREDFQVKIRGHRIELGEIEAALSLHSEIREVVVATVGSERDNKRLVAYVVAQREPPPATAALREFLRKKLPEHMIPAAIVFLPSLPMTPSGKVDRKKLPHPALAASPRTASSERPLTAVGARIAAIVTEVLGVQTVPPDEELIAMGIDSLAMMQIAARLNENFGFRPAMADIFRLTTVSALAEYYEERQQGSAPYHDKADTVIDPRIGSAIADFKLLLDPQERENFKKQQLGLRKPCAETSEPSCLLPGSLPEAVSESYANRRSRRHFCPAPVTPAQFGEFLSPLRQRRSNGSAKYLYGSGGGLYPVQTYLHVKQGRVQAIGEGIYYYHPRDHRLVLLSEGISLHRGIHSPANRLIFDEAAFSIFLVGRLSAIAPIYGEGSVRFMFIEAGLIAQLLEMTAPSCQIGLCQIGTLDFESIRAAFALEESDIFLHALLGGATDEASSRLELGNVPGIAERSEHPSSEREEGIL